MKGKLNIMIVALAMTSLMSCSVSGPLFLTDNPGGPGAKTGEASAKVILGFIRPMNMDISIATAAKNGGITKVSTVDSKITGGLFSKTYTTLVTGN